MLFRSMSFHNFDVPGFLYRVCSGKCLRDFTSMKNDRWYDGFADLRELMNGKHPKRPQTGQSICEAAENAKSSLESTPRDDSANDPSPRL